MFPKFFSKKIIWPIIIGLLLILPAFSFEASVGFLYDQFPLTLEPGQRTEAAGPFFYSEKKEGENTWAIPPFFRITQIRLSAIAKTIFYIRC
jgi:hypothetical protein